jgi:NADH-quinone oxidoreductase subunit E
MAVLEGERLEEARAIIARYPQPRSALLPLLYLVQSVEGHVTREGMREIGELLDLSTAEVQAVATFYTMFKLEPTGRWLVSVCTNVSCAVVGGRKVFERAREALGEDAISGTTEDGLFTLEEVECLGACDAAPIVQVNYCSYDRVTEDGMTEIIDALRAGDPPPPARGPKPRTHAEMSRILAGLGDDRA